MLINNRYRFIYLHVPKTAGTTVHTVLHELSGPADIDLGGVWSPKASTQNKLYQEVYGIEKHSRAARARNIIGKDLFDSYFTFAFVRNPFSRTLSSFRYAQSVNGMNGALENMTFSEYLRTDIFQNLKMQGSQSQAKFLEPLERMDMLFRFERLESDLRRLLEIILRKEVREITLPHLNKSASGDEWKKLPEDDKDIIRQVLARDFEELGYDLETGEVREEFGISFPQEKTFSRPA